MGKNGKGIPEDWEDYSSISKQITGTRFIAFKVPLKDALLNNLDVSVEFFDVNSLVEQCPNLGLVIDLTNTDRYYDSKEFREHNISHYKLKTFGHFVPPTHIVFKFFDVVEGFLTNNRNDGKLVGVHCTHGVNRTGYMIIRYMIQKLHMKPDDAISAFNIARGHALEKEIFLEDLKKSDWPKPPKFTPRTWPMHRVIPRQERVEDDTMIGSGPLLRPESIRRDYGQSSLSNPYQKEVIPLPRHMSIWDRPSPFPVHLLSGPGGPHSRQNYFNDEFKGHIEPSVVNRLNPPICNPNLDNGNHHSQGLSARDPRRLYYKPQTQNSYSSPKRRTLLQQSSRHEISLRPLIDDPLPLPTYRRPIGEAPRLGKPYYEQMEEIPCDSDGNNRDDRAFESYSDDYKRQDRAFDTRSLSSLLHDPIPRRCFRESDIYASKPFHDDFINSQRFSQNLDPLVRENSFSTFERLTDMRSLPREPRRRDFNSRERNFCSSDDDFPPRMGSSRFIPY